MRRRVRLTKKSSLGNREVFIHFPFGMGRSELRLTAMSDGTIRNINTVAKLVKKVDGSMRSDSPKRKGVHIAGLVA